MIKKILFLFTVLAISTGVGATLVSADDFVDYGVNSAGHQCFDEKDESGECDIIYSDDRTLIGDDNSLNVSSSAILAQPNSPSHKELVAIQKAKRKQICLIIFCEDSGSNYNR